MICQKEANPIRKNAVKQFVQQHSFYVGVSGLEPEKAGPESAVLPLHHTPNLGCTKEDPLFNTGAKLLFFVEHTKFFDAFLNYLYRFL